MRQIIAFLTLLSAMALADEDHAFVLDSTSFYEQVIDS
jgi:hypothetical protein